jgi:hypothetical protein
MKKEHKLHTSYKTHTRSQRSDHKVITNHRPVELRNVVRVEVVATSVSLAH